MSTNYVYFLTFIETLVALNVETILAWFTPLNEHHLGTMLFFS